MTAGPTEDALAERDEELGRLEAALSRAGAGDGGLVVVEGPAGIGKSRLLEAARGMAGARELRTLRARGGELERDFAYGVVRQLLERELLELPEAERGDVLSGAARHAAPALGMGSELAPPTGDAAFPVMHGLYWVVSNLASRGPLVLEIDDAHWADGPTLRFADYLVGRLEGLPVLTLVAVRLREPGIDAELLARLSTQAGAEVIRPVPLSPQGVATVAARRLEADPDPGFIDACHAASGGNPFLLSELLAALAADGVAPDAGGAKRVEQLGPETVSRSLLLRLAGLPAAAGDLAPAVAVLGAEADLSLAAALAGIPLEAAGQAADALSVVQILAPRRPLAFVHPVVRQAIYQDIPPTERAAMHARAAQLLRGSGAASPQRAVHLLATEPAGDAETVASLREAARGALDHGAADVARRLLSRALAEPPPAEAAAAVLADLGEAEWLAGDDLEAAVTHLSEAVEGTADPDERAGRVLVLARALFSGGQVTAAFELLEREIAGLEGADREAVMRLEAELASVGLLNPPTVAFAAERLERFVGLQGDTPAELLQIANLASWKWLAGTAEEVRVFAERALRDRRLLEAEGSDSIPVHEAVWVLTYADRHDLALELLKDALADARARGSVFGFTASCAMLALVALRRGAVAEAEAEARNGVALPGLPPFVQPAIFGFLALALVERGQLEEADAAIEQSGCGPHLPELVHMNPTFFARGALRLAQGRYEEALADFLELGNRDERLGIRNPGVPWRLGAAQAQVFCGRFEEAAPLVAEHERVARHWGTASALGVALHARGLLQGPDGIGLLHEAQELLAASPARLDHARLLVDLGVVLRVSGERTSAREPLRTGLEIARRLGATALVERAHAELVTAGARPRRLMFSGVESLTASERRVAEMVADGQTNREVAQALFVTVKTVENHLGRAYTKLGIGSREELPRALADRI